MRMKKLLYLGVGSLIAIGAVGITRGIAQQPKETLMTPAANALPVSEPAEVATFSRRVVTIPPEQENNLARISALEIEGKQFLRQQQWADAEAKLKEAIGIEPDRTPVWIYAELAEAQYKLGKSQDALKSMKKAFFGKATMGTPPRFVVRFADIAEQCGEPELVSKLWEGAYRDARATNSNIQDEAQKAKTAEQKRALVLVAAGLEAQYGDDPIRMMELNQQALQLDPKCALAHFNLARMSGRTPEAMAHLEAAGKYCVPSFRLVVKTEMEVLRYYLNQQKKK